MMDHKIDKLISAIGDMNTAYLEEAIAFDGAKVGQQKAVRSKKLSAALVAALVILGLSLPSADSHCRGVTFSPPARLSSATRTRNR